MIMTAGNFLWTLTANDEVSSKYNSKLKNRRSSKTRVDTNVMVTPYQKKKQKNGRQFERITKW